MKYIIYIDDEQLSKRITKALHSLFIYKKIDSNPVLATELPQVQDAIIFTDQTDVSGSTVLYLGSQPHVADYSLGIEHLKLTDFESRIKVFKNLMRSSDYRIPTEPKKQSVAERQDVLGNNQVPLTLDNNEQVENPQESIESDEISSAHVDNDEKIGTSKSPDKGNVPEDDIFSNVDLNNLGIESSPSDSNIAADDMFAALGIESSDTSDESLVRSPEPVPTKELENDSDSIKEADEISKALQTPRNTKEADQVMPVPEESKANQQSHDQSNDDINSLLDEFDDSIQASGSGIITEPSITPKSTIERKRVSDEALKESLESNFNHKKYDVLDQYDPDSLASGRLVSTIRQSGNVPDSDLKKDRDSIRQTVSNNLLTNTESSLPEVDDSIFGPDTVPSDITAPSRIEKSSEETDLADRILTNPLSTSDSKKDVTNASKEKNTSLKKTKKKGLFEKLFAYD